jgi:TonB-linked SusC/RagA family outer membrane protein
MYKPNTDKSMNLNAFNLGVPSLRIPPTLLLMMRLTILMLCAGILQVSARTYGQKITLTQRNAPLVAVLKELRKQSGYDFLYSDKIMEQAKPVSLDVKNAGLEEVLERCFENQPLSYNIENKIVTIKAKTPSFLEKLAAAWRNADVHCRVEDEKGEPLAGASVRVKGTNKAVVTDEKGEFTLNNVDENAVIIISYLGYKVKEIPAKEVYSSFAIKMELVAGELKEVKVNVSTGYQTLNKERATGSFVQVDNQLLNRSVSTDVLSRLDGVTSGMFFKNNGFLKTGNDPTISIRGRSTLFANTDPLIVLDNFPFNGDLNNINPNDIESVTILKDAAAASIWGVRAGNGVIVLTSKKGKYNSALRISFNSFFSVAEKQNLFAKPQMSSAQYIEVERFLFDNGYYNGYLKGISALSPVVELLDQQRKGLISVDGLNNKLNALSKIDARENYSRYFLRSAQQQQYALSISGGGAQNQYYFSAGYDRNLSGAITSDYNRLTLNARNTYNLFKDRLELSTDLYFVKNRSKYNDGYSYSINYPYEQVVDNSGAALSVIRDYRSAVKDGFLGKGLLDWNYYPMNERFNQTATAKENDYTLNLGLNYKILPHLLSVQASYQYQQGNSERVSTYALDSYLIRNRINNFSQIDPITGIIFRPIPLGDNVNVGSKTYTSQSGRLQLNYHQMFGGIHEITAIAGTEIKDYNAFSRKKVVYGYNASTATDQPVDHFKDYPTLMGGTERIPIEDNQGGTTDRYISYYANAAYSYRSKYTLSASVRKDESNLFGVNANQKGVPLYSMGLSWDLSKESFYHLNILPYTKLRFTYGYNGNLSKDLSAYITAIQNYYLNDYGAVTQQITNPPNPSLRWEKVQNINTGIDFSLKNQVLSGSIEFYSKKGMDLIGDSQYEPQSGITQFKGNTAETLTKGVDVTLNSVNLKGNFGWTTTFLLNYVKDKVIAYRNETGVNSDYVGLNYRNPMVGKPYSAIFAYAWAGLDGQGNPQGYLDGKISKDYGSIMNTKKPEQLIYKGTATPTFFGSLRNNFSYKGFDLSLNIIYKMGYYFRRGSYSGTLNEADYEKRWQKPGDENHTIVPSVIYPNDGRRTSFFRGSEVLVERGDHIRLQDLQVGYTFNSLERLGLHNLKLSFMASNLGAILWRANKLGLDPDNVGAGYYFTPRPRGYSANLTVNL